MVPFVRYLPGSLEDEKLGMRCTTAGAAVVPPGGVYPAHQDDHPAMFRPVAEGRVLPEFQLVYVTGGEGIFSCAGRDYQVKPGCVLLVLPGCRHAYHPLPETGWNECWVGFTGGYFSSLLEEGRFSPEHVFFETGLHDSMFDAFNHIIDEVKYRRPLFQFKTCALILLLAAEVLERERRGVRPNRCEQMVARAKLFMESNVSGAIHIPAVSGQLGLSVSQLNRIFKDCTSMTPYQYYIHIKMLRAERLLAEDDMSVKEAAYELGFDDQYYFSRLFKNKTGVSPSSWKKRGGHSEAQ